MTEILAALVLTALAILFAAFSHGSLKARLTGRANHFAPIVGSKRPGSTMGALAFAWLAFLFFVGALGLLIGAGR